MSKKNVSKTMLASEELDRIELALVKAMCSAGDTGLRPHVLEGALRRRLHQLTEGGITDPEALKDAALRSVQIVGPSSRADLRRPN